ncbi:MAG: DUF4446 family protein [Candidatus Shapirobacteria bacterium]|nr:DUF4446 family protein [Candidatus Shapirobacteria bacterium]MDD5073983.1 DUF4446 family protein [Candidatus Shapirobacteria bacterium]MDD5481606.1 DUF4446 family protein [Candidatus Shapirobacteria bacterium]
MFSEDFLTGLNIVWLVVFFWLSALTIFLVLAIRRYQKLTRGVGSGSLDKIIQKILADQEKSNKEVGLNRNKISLIEDKAKNYFQKMALVRYNPFNQTGGNQSFSLTLLDKENSGIVISSFHSREGTRLYAKIITLGKTDDSFSKEEKMAVKEAINKRQ